MNRRTLLAAILWTPSVLAALLDALLVGDSHAFQLGPRLRSSMRRTGRRLQVEARGGTSTKQWLVQRWFRDALVRYPASTVLVSLGTNCTRSERGRLERDIAELTMLANDRGVRPIWLLPPTRKFPVEYITHAVDSVGVDVVRTNPVPLEVDMVHATDRGLRIWSEQIVREVWS